MAKDAGNILTSLLYNRSKPRSLVLAVIFFLIVVWVIRSSLPLLGDYRTYSSPVFNSTLGFSQILGIDLPDSDRKDALLAAGKAANLDITIFDALRPSDISPADKPKNWGKNDYKPKPGVLGCLMSHVTIWKKMIDENIASILVMESDADFDLRIKQSMMGLSRGVKAIADFPFTPQGPVKPSHSPYGDNWDVLWIGHCGANTNGDGRVFTYNDAAAGGPGHVWAPYAKMKNVKRAEGTRLVFQLRDVVCTAAYAISNQGARKMKERFETVNQPVDLEMLKQCTKDPELVCLSTFPQIISMVEALPSSIDGEKKMKNDLNGTLTTLDPTVGQGIQISARKNAAQGTADGQPKFWLKEWEDSTT